jgi:hypothetical protein
MLKKIALLASLAVLVAVPGIAEPERFCPQCACGCTWEDPGCTPCPPLPSCTQTCGNEYQSCKNGCGGGDDCIAECVAERTACLAGCGGGTADVSLACQMAE